MWERSIPFTLRWMALAILLGFANSFTPEEGFLKIIEDLKKRNL
jgi:hypothetical protein